MHCGSQLPNCWCHIPEDSTLLKANTLCVDHKSHVAFICFAPELKFLIDPVAADLRLQGSCFKITEILV
jgi:hypothetical protein